ncbi:glycoside hydrolase family 1 protein [Candidatus Dependentiae bacterium]
MKKRLLGLMLTLGIALSVPAYSSEADQVLQEEVASTSDRFWKGFAWGSLATAGLITAGLMLKHYLFREYNVLRWNWDQINVNDLHFPENFKFGVSTSSYQVEGGCTTNQWCEHECTTTDENGDLRMPEASGDACDHWNRYREDVQLIKNINATAYRFSVEWSKIQPALGVWDEDALQHYVDVCEELIANGIAPVVTMVHYTIPQWFADMGGFENEENIQYFVAYAEKLFEVLGDRVELWLTFNSPSGYALPAYQQGTKPPYQKDMQLAVVVLKNVCEAHVRAYQAIKVMEGGDQAQIGIMKNVYQLDPVNLIGRVPASIGSSLTNQCMYDFFRDGEFRVRIPFKVNFTHNNPEAPNSLDFVGLNYYSHAQVKGFSISPFDEDEIMTANGRYTIYAEGLYRALHEINEQIVAGRLIPIYVTENGISPAQEDHRRIFLEQYLYALSRAIQDGVDVRGYFHWSLMDNYEWGTYDQRFGLYHVDFDSPDKTRTLKPSAQHFVDVAGRYADGGLRLEEDEL